MAETHDMMEDAPALQATQQKEMSIFASLEHKAAAEALSSATTQCASLEAKLQEQTAVLDKTKEDAVSGQCRLQACEAEVRSASCQPAVLSGANGALCTFLSV